MKKWLVIALILAAVGGGFYWWRHGRGAQALTEKTLTFAEVRRATIRDIVSATGLVEPRELVFVSTETPGTVVRLVGRVGQTVKDGDELAQLDDRKIQLKVAESENGVALAEAAFLQAKAALAKAQANKTAAERYWEIQKELQKAGPGFRTEREMAEANYHAAMAGVEEATAGIEAAKARKNAAETARAEAKLVQRLARITVPNFYLPKPDMAPREFLLLERKAHEGQMVGPQSGPLFMLAGNLDVVEVHAQVAEGDVNKIKTRLKAIFKVSNYEDQDSEFDDGRVREIRPLATAEIRGQAGAAKGAVYYNAIIEVKNRKDPSTGDWQLRPGMTVSVDIVRHERVNAWRVPVGALNFKMEDAYQDAAARAHLAAWSQRADKDDWRALWIWDKEAQRANPVFVRINGKPGELALKDAEGNEILEWEPGKEPTGAVQVIIGAPPARAPSFFDQPANVKI